MSVCVMWSIYIYVKQQTNKREYIGVCCWLGWLAGLGVVVVVRYRPPPGPPPPLLPNQEPSPKAQRTLNGIALIVHTHILCVCVQPTNGGYLVDPASSHMLVSKIKPCMSKYKLVYTARLRMAH